MAEYKEYDAKSYAAAAEINAHQKLMEEAKRTKIHPKTKGGYTTSKKN